MKSNFEKEPQTFLDINQRIALNPQGYKCIKNLIWPWSNKFLRLTDTLQQYGRNKDSLFNIKILNLTSQ